MARRLLHLLPAGTEIPVPLAPGDTAVSYRLDSPTGRVSFEVGPPGNRRPVPPERVVALLFEHDGAVGW